MPKFDEAMTAASLREAIMTASRQFVVRAQAGHPLVVLVPETVPPPAVDAPADFLVVAPPRRPRLRPRRASGAPRR